MGWGQPCRLCHVTSGRYLAGTADNQVVTFHRSAATEDATAFLVRQSKVHPYLCIFILILKKVFVSIFLYDNFWLCFDLEMI